MVRTKIQLAAETIAAIYENTNNEVRADAVQTLLIDMIDSVALLTDLAGTVSIYVPQSRRLSINGTAYDLSADRAWAVGTVTSISAGTGMSFTTRTTTGTVDIDKTQIPYIPTGFTTGFLKWSGSGWVFDNTSYLSTLLSIDITTALGFTPYNATNPAGYITTISGITAGGELSGTYANPSLSNTAVIGKVLTGLNVTGSSIASTDTILAAFGKVQNQINGLLGGVQYQGVWNANTNSPALVSSTGTKGYYYVVSVSGSTNIDGITDWKLGDWIIFDGTIWNKVDNTDAVSSVNGYNGTVSLTTSDIAQGTNLYFTNSAAINSVLTGYVSGAGTVAATDSILQAIQKLNGNISSFLSSSLTSANIFVGNGSNVATGVAMSGDITIGNTGVTAIGNLKVTNAMIAASTIDLTAKVTGILPVANGGRLVIHQSNTQFTSVSTNVDEVAFSILLPAGTVTTNDFIDLTSYISTLSAGGAKTWKYFIGSSNQTIGATQSGATLLATMATTSSFTVSDFHRKIAVINNTTVITFPAGTAMNGYTAVGGTLQSVNITVPSLASNTYLILTLRRANSGDTLSSEFMRIVPLKS